MEPPLVSHKLGRCGETRNPNEEWKARCQDNCDDLGKELHPESPMWKIYAEEAREQDTELTAGYNKNLDTLLIFATLYSAILTAFLVDSRDLLEPDNEEITVTLLLSLVQSQRRVETGSPNPLSPPVEIPHFQPSRSARSINVLWFTSLILSLGVVMLAMLAKEWLVAFTSYKTRHAYKYTLQRQARFDSLKSWRMLPIIDFLPILLHFSYFLFLIGLIIRLWLLDRIVAYFTTLIGISGIMLYMGFVILGAAVVGCPYEAKLSGHIRSVLSLLNYKNLGGKPRVTKQLNEEHHAEQQDLYALQWFLDRGRDPATISTACQSLAGLKTLKLNQVHFNIGRSLGPGHYWTSQQSIKPYSTILKLGSRVLNRLKAATAKYYNELAICRGANAARYAIALSEIYPYALSWIKQSNQLVANIKRLDTIEKMNTDAYDIVNSVFHALDLVWEDKATSVAYTTDSYVHLTIAELKIIGHIVEYLEQDPALPQEISVNHIAIAMFETPGVVKFLRGPNLLADLRKRYHRALGRAALLIQDSFNISKDIPIASSTRMIYHTLSTIMDLVTVEQLHSDSPINQDLYSYDGEIIIPVSTATEHNIPRLISTRLGMRTGLLASIMSLWGPGAEGPHRSREVEIVALNLMSKIGPDLMNQWATRYGQQWLTFNQPPGPTERFPPNVSDNLLRRSIVSQLLEIANFSMIFLDHPNMYQLAEVALESLSCQADAQDGQSVIHEMLISHLDLLVLWVEKLQLYRPTEGPVVTEDTSANWVSVQLAKLLATKGPEGRTICRSFLEHSLQQSDHDSEKLTSIMTMMSAPQGSPLHTERLLYDITDYVTNTSGPYLTFLEAFTKNKGFDCLLSVGATNPMLAAGVTIDIVIHLTQSEKWIEQEVVYAFLQVVCLACNFPPQNWIHVSNVFIPSTISHLQRLQPSLEKFADTNTIHTIDLALRRLKAEAEYMTIEQSKIKAICDLTKIANAVQSSIKLSGPRRVPAAIHTTPNAWEARLQAALQPAKGREGGWSDDGRSMDEFHLQSAATSIMAIPGAMM
ncbi:hypothetical protein RHS03_06625, partial [Rhizoctonia solani]